MTHQERELGGVTDSHLEKLLENSGSTAESGPFWARFVELWSNANRPVKSAIVATLTVAVLLCVILPTLCHVGKWPCGESDDANHSAISGLTYSGFEKEYIAALALIQAKPTLQIGDPFQCSWTVQPPLPSGVEINTRTGAIQGTPMELTAPTTYVVTATLGTAQASTSFTFFVVQGSSQQWIDALQIQVINGTSVVLDQQSLRQYPRLVGVLATVTNSSAFLLTNATAFVVNGTTATLGSGLSAASASILMMNGLAARFLGMENVPLLVLLISSLRDNTDSLTPPMEVALSFWGNTTWNALRDGFPSSFPTTSWTDSLKFNGNAMHIASASANIAVQLSDHDIKLLRTRSVRLSSAPLSFPDGLRVELERLKWTETEFFGVENLCDALNETTLHLSLRYPLRLDNPAQQLSQLQHNLTICPVRLWDPLNETEHKSCLWMQLIGLGPRSETLRNVQLQNYARLRQEIRECPPLLPPNPQYPPLPTAVGRMPYDFKVTDTGDARLTMMFDIHQGRPPAVPSIGVSIISSQSSGSNSVGVEASLIGDSLAAITRTGCTLEQDGYSQGITLTRLDKFSMDGLRFVPIQGPNGGDGTEYRTEIDSFAQIFSHGQAGNGPREWIVFTKAGMTLRFGNTDDSRVLAQGKNSVLLWALSSVEDSVGNYVNYTYCVDTKNAKYHLNRVDYTGNRAATGNFTFSSLRFFYEQRPDELPIYTAGSLVNSADRLQRIESWALNENFVYELVRQYRFSYEQGCSQSGYSHLTALQECTATFCLNPIRLLWNESCDGSFSSTMTGPPTFILTTDESKGLMMTQFMDIDGDGRTDVYQFTTNDPITGQPQPDIIYVNISKTVDGAYDTLVGPRTNIPPSSDSSIQRAITAIKFADIDGDGSLDVIQINAFATTPTPSVVFVNQGNGSFAHPILGPNFTVPISDTEATNYLTGIIVRDMNNDNRDDLYVVASCAGGVPPGPDTIWLADTSPSHAFNPLPLPGANTLLSCLSAQRSVELKLIDVVDMDANGLPDVVTKQWVETPSPALIAWQLSNNSFSNFTVMPGTSFSVRRPVEQATFDAGLCLLSDLTNDGLPDYYCLDYTQQAPSDSIYLNTGNGSFVVSPSPLHIPLSTDSVRMATLDQTRFFTLDVNRDGLSDFARINGWGSDIQNLTWYLNRGNLSFIAIPGPAFPIRNSIDQAMRDLQRIARVQNDGRLGADFYHIPISDSPLNATILLNSFAPPLFSGFQDSLGNLVTIDYRPLTDSTVYRKGSGAQYPVRDTLDSSQVVSRSCQSDGIGGMRCTRYSYSGLRKHLRGLGNLGFASKSQTDEVSGLTVLTVLSQDYSTRLQHQVISVTNFGPISSVLTVKQSRWDSRVRSTAGGLIYWPYSPSTVARAFDLVGTFLSQSTTMTTYDDYGCDLTSFVRVCDSAFGCYDTNITKSYQTFPGHWRYGLANLTCVAKQSLSSPPITRCTWVQYDPDTTLPVQTVSDPDTLFQITSTVKRDLFGFAAATTLSGNDFAPRTEYSHHDAWGLYSFNHTNALGHTELYHHNYVFGGIDKHIDFNNLPRTFVLDGMGRVASSQAPDGTVSKSSWWWLLSNGTLEYGGGDPSCSLPYWQCPCLAVYVTVACPAYSAPSATCFDKFDRPLRVQTPSADEHRWVWMDSEHDALGRVVRVSTPYFSTANPVTVNYTTTDYDALNRPIRRVQADNSTTTTP